MKAYGPVPSGKWYEGGSSNTVIISGDRILPVQARTEHNRENPAIGYNRHMTATIVLACVLFLIETKYISFKKES